MSNSVRDASIALAFYDELEHKGWLGWFGFVNSWSENWGAHGVGYMHSPSFHKSPVSIYEIFVARRFFEDEAHKPLLNQNAVAGDSLVC